MVWFCYSWSEDVNFVNCNFPQIIQLMVALKYWPSAKKGSASSAVKLYMNNARVNSHQRWKQTRNRVCFHLWCELTSTMNVSWNSCVAFQVAADQQNLGSADQQGDTALVNWPKRPDQGDLRLTLKWPWSDHGVTVTRLHEWPWLPEAMAFRLRKVRCPWCWTVFFGSSFFLYFPLTQTRGRSLHVPLQN